MPGTRGELLALDHVRRLVGRDPDPVTGAVDELLAVPGVADELTSRTVDLLARHTRAYCVHARLLRQADDLVHLQYLLVRLADCHRAAGVRPVAEHESTEVEHHAVAALDHPVTGLVVGVRPVRSRADHGEVDLLVPEVTQQLGEIGGDVRLTPAGELHLDDLAERRIGSCSRGSKPVELVRVLHGTHHGHALGERAVRRARQGALEAQHVERPSIVRDAVGAGRSQQGDGSRVGIGGIRPVADRHAAGALRGLGIWTFQRRYEQGWFLVRRQHQHGQALSDRCRAVSREPDQVRPGGDQDPGKPQIGGGRGDPSRPLKVVVRGERRLVPGQWMPSLPLTPPPR